MNSVYVYTYTYASVFDCTGQSHVESKEEVREEFEENR